jgi:hypothetical protein
VPCARTAPVFSLPGSRSVTRQYFYRREELPGVRDHDDVTNIIGVDIALSDDAVRPHVATVTFGGNHILSS